MDTSSAAAKYDFYEVVEVTKPGKLEAQGYIAGKAQGDDGSWYYGVLIYSSQIVWSASEREIRSLGRIDENARDKEKHRPVIKVYVDPETGEGYLKE